MLESGNSGPRFFTSSVFLLYENSEGPGPPALRSSPRKISISGRPTWLLMFRQYEYPTYARQSVPPQSSAFVNRTAVVPYGAGNLKGPFASFAGRNPRIWFRVNRGRNVCDPAFSRKPPYGG